MSNADPLLRLIRVLEDELRTPPEQRASGATDSGLQSAIMDAQQAVLEVEGALADDVRDAMAHAPESSRRLWSQVVFDGRRTINLAGDRSDASSPDAGRGERGSRDRPA